MERGQNRIPRPLRIALAMIRRRRNINIDSRPSVELQLLDTPRKISCTASPPPTRPPIWASSCCWDESGFWPAGFPPGERRAAWFLKEFAEETPWVHLDIAGTAWLDDPKPYMTKGPSGIELVAISL